jgi:hypothetical protein
VIVPVGATGAVSIFVNAGSTNVIVDVSGWYTNGSQGSQGFQFIPLAPTRVFDTRTVYGGPIGPYATPFGPGQSRPLTIAGTGGVPSASASRPPRAVLVNATIADTNDDSYLTIYPDDGSAVPNVSDQNWVPGDVRANLAQPKLGSNGGIRMYNNRGTVDVILDLNGWFG